jgi:hypothetical protein
MRLGPADGLPVGGSFGPVPVVPSRTTLIREPESEEAAPMRGLVVYESMFAQHPRRGRGGGARRNAGSGRIPGRSPGSKVPSLNGRRPCTRRRIGTTMKASKEDT